ncbi:MAG TPA: hypothetical protein ENI96_01490 [Sedimenticola thiotaurini]|uniref:Uncharacterized protein n=1 Tax=Sedimenticola thiotaurini TaxID=1543721 RepID=A0A831RJL4_9GAMM|nr:hypothetical protein [Sedimenticola thiotaurini]
MQLDPLILWSLGELLLISLVAAVVLALRAFLQRRRDRSAAMALVGQIRSDEERRRQETRELLGGRYGIPGDLLDDLVGAICREEKRFYQTLINLYLMRDSVALRGLNLAFEGAVGPYRDLPVNAAPEGAEQAGDSVAPVNQADDAELQRLQDENARLSDELRITMDTMGRMLSEYSSMFAGGEGEELDKEKMIAMFQADAGEQARQQETPAAAEEGEPPGPPAADDGAAARTGAEGSSDGEDAGAEVETAAPADAAEAPGDEGLMSLDDDLAEMEEDAPKEAAPQQVQL